MWSLIAALAPAIRAGSVRVCVVDPKGGMEFGRGAELFTGFAHDNSEHTLALLHAVVTVMQKRAARLRGRTRLHTATVGAPLILLVVDELASLTAYIGDRRSAPKSNNCSVCCSPKVAPSEFRSSPPCKTPRKRSCRSGSCLRCGSGCG